MFFYLQATISKQLLLLVLLSFWPQSLRRGCSLRTLILLILYQRCQYFRLLLQIICKKRVFELHLPILDLPLSSRQAFFIISIKFAQFFNHNWFLQKFPANYSYFDSLEDSQQFHSYSLLFLKNSYQQLFQQSFGPFHHRITWELFSFFHWAIV